MNKAGKVRVEKKFDGFNARHYLEEYYSSVGQENREILNFLHKAYSIIFSDLKEAKFLELGGGPTIYQLVSAAKYPVEIHFSDYLDQNISEVQAWMENKAKKYSWKEFVTHTLQLENQEIDDDAINQRENLIRTKTKKLSHCDLRQKNPLGENLEGYYDIVSMNFVAESMTAEISEWKEVFKNALSLIKPDGYLVMTVIIGASRYKVGDLHFPAAPVDRQMVLEELSKLGFQVMLEHDVEAEQEEEQGYQGIRMFLAKRLTRN